MASGWASSQWWAELQRRHCGSHAVFTVLVLYPLQVFYNNLLSLPCCVILMALTGELRRVWDEPDLRNAAFLLVASFSGLIGFAIRHVCCDACVW